LSQVSPGDTINLGFGSYYVAEPISTNVTILGETANVSLITASSVDSLISTNSQVTLENLILQGNSEFAPTIYNTGTITLIDDELVTHVPEPGLVNDGGTAILKGDTVGGQADGIDNNNGTLTLTDDTITENNSVGVRNTQSTGLATTTAIADTIVGNTGDGIDNVGGTITVAASIVANNGTNCSGGVTDGGYNLDSGTSCGFSSAAHSLSMTNPDLMEFVTGNYNWGGPTPVQPPALGSPALGAIPSGTAGTDCPGTDQRGQPKPAPALDCAIGAVQSVFPVAPTHSYSVPMGTTLSVPVSQGLLSGSIADANLGSQTFTAAVPFNSFPTHGTLDPDFTGAFRYTPTTGFAGADKFSYTVTDSDSFVSAPTTVTIDVIPPAPTIASFSPLSGAVGSRVTITGTNLETPSEVAFNGVRSTIASASPTSLIVLVPSGNASGDITVVTTGGTAVSTQQFVQTGPVSPIFSVSPTPLPNATPRLHYSLLLQAIDGVKPYRWTIVSGALPLGLHLSAHGLIRGTPRAHDMAGSFTFTVQVQDHRSSRDGGRQTATKALTLHLL